MAMKQSVMRGVSSGTHASRAAEHYWMMTRGLINIVKNGHLKRNSVFVKWLNKISVQNEIGLQ